jgi:hypothetical protein
VKNEVIEFEGRKWERTGKVSKPEIDEVFITLDGFPMRLTIPICALAIGEREILREIPSPSVPGEAPEAVKELARKLFDNYRGMLSADYEREIRAAIGPLLQEGRMLVDELIANEDITEDAPFVTELARWEPKP